MCKRLILISLISVSPALLATSAIDLHHAPLTSLQPVNQTQEGSKTITRYQQFYKDIPVIGAQIMVAKDSKQMNNTKISAQINGHLLEEIELNTQPAITSQAALDLAKQAYFNNPPAIVGPRPNLQAYGLPGISAALSQLQIRADSNNQLILTYLVSFKTIKSDAKPAWPSFIIDAQTGEIIEQWDNIKTYLDSGPGGNEKVHEYWYGKDDLPGLEVTQNDTLCIMESAKVKLINVKEQWDWDEEIHEPYQYTCNNNLGEPIHGAYSPNNDAYYFGHVIIDMYQNWYEINALQHASGKPMQLVIRTHFGQHLDNAFWDGQTMIFGDGEEYYPPISLDITAHEIAHGFTEQHANLEYHDQSGAINESFSDMAGLASRAYVLATNPKFYNKIYLTPNKITWGIGETITRNPYKHAIRFMDYPADDGNSAECLDSELAQKNGVNCSISYDRVVDFANQLFTNPQKRQSFIVHKGSGVFNRAFYLLAHAIGIKKAFQVMVNANIKYWTPNSDFITGACGVLNAANDLQIDPELMSSTFAKVGIETATCSTGKSTSA